MEMSIRAYEDAVLHFWANVPRKDYIYVETHIDSFGKCQRYSETVIIHKLDQIDGYHVIETDKGTFKRAECYTEISPYGWRKVE